MNAIDLFAGAGGFTSGAVRAGADVIWAANHWKVAVECHAENHPDTEHVCQDLNTFPSCEIPDHDLLLASPSCKGFSPARGANQSHDDKHRATAWIVIDVLEAKRPGLAVIENVKEMLKWSLYPAWKLAVEILGYQCQELILDAADFGVPQNRNRLFIVLNKGKAKVDLHFERVEHTPVSSCLDWSSGSWRDIYRPNRSVNTIARIEQAIKDGFGERFLMPYYGSGSGNTGRSLNRPIGTLTTRARWGLVDMARKKMRMLNVSEARDCMGFDADYSLPKNKAEANAVLGNAVCPPVAEAIVRQLQR